MGQENPNPKANDSNGKLKSFVSHWYGGPFGWDFSVSTEHQ